MKAREIITETDALADIRVAASENGCRLWRNNRGMAWDETGRPIRYGLANDSAQASKEIKSSDLIGIMPRLITGADVGKIWGLFMSIEAKRPGWHYTGKDQEPGQKKWIDLILAFGGIAGFATKREDIWPS